MSGLSVLKVYGSLPDLFKMFNSTIGTFHRTTADALQRSSLAGLVAELLSPGKLKDTVVE